jgi:hypothetical protein
MRRDIAAQSPGVNGTDGCASSGANGAADSRTQNRSGDDLGVCGNWKHEGAKNGGCCKDSSFHCILLLVGRWPCGHRARLSVI